MITGIHLITGLIGSGKTLRAVWYIDQEVKAGRPVYVCNVNGLSIPGVIPFEDPRKWRDLPPGSLLVVDEAQRYWRARRSGDVPEELQEAETSRHDGVAMLVMTQQPSYLDKHLRGLVTCHEHLYRRMGMKATEVYAWNRCVEDPHGSDKAGADQSLFIYPKHLFSAYKSADVHTVKTRIGPRAKLVIGALLVSAALIAWALSSSFGGKPLPATVAPAAASGLTALAASPDAAGGKGRAQQPRWNSASEYAAAHLPRFPTLPWSAPVFDQRPATSDPQLVCMSAEAGTDAEGRHRPASCTCFTEQGTRYDIRGDDNDGMCRKVARYGPSYNPYRDRRAGAQEGPQIAAEGAGSATPTSSASAAQQSGAVIAGAVLPPTAIPSASSF